MALRHACRINGIDKIAVTKLDVLDNMEKIKVCVGYTLDGGEISEVPMDLSDLWHVKPVYREFDGWMTSTTEVSDFKALPENARNYLGFITGDLGVDICLVSTGARREETIVI